MKFGPSLVGGVEGGHNYADVLFPTTTTMMTMMTMMTRRSSNPPVLLYVLDTNAKLGGGAETFTIKLNIRIIPRLPRGHIEIDLQENSYLLLVESRNKGIPMVETVLEELRYVIIRHEEELELEEEEELELEEEEELELEEEEEEVQEEEELDFPYHRTRRFFLYKLTRGEQQGGRGWRWL